MMYFYVSRLNGEQPHLKAFNANDHRLREVIGHGRHLTGTYIRRWGALLYSRRTGMFNQRLIETRTSEWTNSKCFFTDGSNVITVDFVYFTQCHPYGHVGSPPHITRVILGPSLDSHKIADVLGLDTPSAYYDLEGFTDSGWVMDYQDKMLSLRFTTLDVDTVATPLPDTELIVW